MGVAEEMSKKQREISVAEFFEKNRHLLGFDNPRKALLTTVKEAVDNSLDACEEAGILPEIGVEIIEMADNRYRLIIEDNGPGIVKKQIPNIFGKLLYGSKFHKLAQSRGQQGIGISAAALYGQLTTGKPIKITSRTGKDKPSYYYELHINTQKNTPEIVKEEEVNWEVESGTKIQLELEGSYAKGQQSVDNYLKQTAIANPHITIIYTNPKAEQYIFARATDQLPDMPEEIKPHPQGVELGMFMKMLKQSESRTLQSFLTNEFSRVSSSNAKEICQNAAILPNTKPGDVTRDQADKMMKVIRKTDFMAPPTDCLAPITAELMEKGVKKEVKAEFYTAASRKPAVYRGNPFIIEAAIAYGGDLKGDTSVDIMRLANRVPLLYQQGACAVTKAIQEVNWKSYGLQQSGSNMPVGPCLITVHIASVWVPFTSEAKEALAHYDEIIKEIKLALQECGRDLASYTKKKKRYADELKKRSMIEKFIPHVTNALEGLLGISDSESKVAEDLLKDILEKKRGKLKKVEQENVEYDEEFAKIGKEEKDDEEE